MDGKAGKAALKGLPTVRIAAIADIHGNDLALEAVLADIAAQQVSDIVNLGDHRSGPQNAARTADILMARNFPSIRGNHDRWLTTRAPEEMNDWDRFYLSYRFANPIFRFSAAVRTSR